MKKYYVSVSKDGKFIFRTEPQDFGAFQITVAHLMHLLDDQRLNFMFHSVQEIHTTTLSNQIDRTHYLDLATLEGLKEA